jgi:hypothetical protein
LSSLNHPFPGVKQARSNFCLLLSDDLINPLSSQGCSEPILLFTVVADVTLRIRAGQDREGSVYIDHEHGRYGLTPLHHQVLAGVRSGTWAGSRDERGVREASMQDNNSNGYFIISFDDNDYRTHFEATDLGTEEQMRIVLDPPYIAMRKSDPNRGQLAGPTKVVVNVIDGGEHNKVKKSLDGGRFKATQ